MSENFGLKTSQRQESFTRDLESKSQRVALYLDEEDLRKVEAMMKEGDTIGRLVKHLILSEYEFRHAPEVEG